MVVRNREMSPIDGLSQEMKEQLYTYDAGDALGYSYIFFAFPLHGSPFALAMIAVIAVGSTLTPVVAPCGLPVAVWHHPVLLDCNHLHVGRAYVDYADANFWAEGTQRTQTSHLPDSHDSTPVRKGKPDYTDWCYGGVSFVLLEDRKFKLDSRMSNRPGRRGRTGL